MAAVDVLREWAVRDVAIGGVAVSSILFRTGSDSWISEKCFDWDIYKTSEIVAIIVQCSIQFYVLLASSQIY